MKTLKHIALGILLIIVLFLCLGIAVPSFDYESKATINSTPDQCWLVLNDTSRMNQWVEGFQSLTLKEGNWMETGSAYEIVLVQDKKYVMREVLNSIKPGESLSFLLINDVLMSEYSYKLFPVNNQTIVEQHYHISGKTIFWRSVLFLSKSYMAKQSQTSLDMLKAVVEGGK